MRTGVSTGCLYPALTEESVETLCGLGFRTLEIFFNTFSELEPAYLERLKTRLNHYGARVSSLHPFTSSYESFLLFSAYERRFEDGVRFYERYFRTAARLGADKVVLHGQQRAFSGAVDRQEYCRRFALLSRQAAVYGVTLLQENVRSFRCNDPDMVRSMRNAIPKEARFVLDTKQALMEGIGPVEMLRAMGPALRHVHISGFDASGACVLPHREKASLLPLFQALREMQYRGDIMIEVYRHSYDRPEELREAGTWLADMLGETFP